MTRVDIRLKLAQTYAAENNITWRKDCVPYPKLLYEKATLDLSSQLKVCQLL